MFSDDVFVEQLVEKQQDAKDRMQKALLVLACVVLSSLSLLLYLVPVVSVLSLPAIVGCIYGAWYLISGLRIEYEYIYTNGELDVDRISAKRRRRRLLTLRMGSIESFGQPDAAARQANYAQTFMACADPAAETTYLATFRDRNGKPCGLYFTPNDKLIEIISSQLQRKAKYGR